jgi:hypothetical protein
MWVDSTRVYRDQPIQIDLVFENHTAERIRDFRFVDFRKPGFDQTGSCWKDNRPACLAGAASAVPIPTTLEPGVAMHLWAQLKPSVSSGSFGILAVYSFSKLRQPEEQNRSRQAPVAPFQEHFTQALSLPPIEITTRSSEVLGGVASILGVPLLATVLGSLVLFGVQSWDKQREAEKQSSERTREAERQSVEKERERAFAVWSEQLKRMFEYIQDHYLPIDSATRLLNEFQAKFRGSPGRLGDPAYGIRALHQFLTWQLQVRELSIKRGGFFLSSSKAEQILGKCSFLFATEKRKRMPDEDLQAAVDVMSKMEQPVSLPAFLSLFKVGQPHATLMIRVRTNFFAWMDGTAFNDAGASFNSCLALLKVMGAVLRFEWDRPFHGYWYAGIPKLESAELDVAIGNLPSEPADKIEQLKALLQEYRDEVPADMK